LFIKKKGISRSWYSRSDNLSNMNLQIINIPKENFHNQTLSFSGAYIYEK